VPLTDTAFHEGVKQALDDPRIRKNFRSAMDGLISKRRSGNAG